ncbi:sulfatase-like hydrolase/transferase, partial [Candidatus Poribacteria bacterium]|nr:sulfatase-like hydrolase/transferase [Candidatus Poribacteria bacterium]
MSARPNVLFMIADDHRFSGMGHVGREAVRTPALDALAARGTAFRKAYIMGGLSGAVCVP